ncbi:dipeptide ABC transporter permease DppC, partial [Rhizobium leguminosarum]
MMRLAENSRHVIRFDNLARVHHGHALRDLGHDRAIVLILVFIAIFAPLIAPHSPIEQYRDNVKIPPAWLDGGNWRFVLGTD